MDDMIQEFDHVRMKSSGVTGIVVDISKTTGHIIVESDEKGVPGGWGDNDSWKLFDCVESDLEKAEKFLNLKPIAPKMECSLQSEGNCSVKNWNCSDA